MEDYEIHWGRSKRSVTPSRHVRATSAAPASGRHYELDSYAGSGSASSALRSSEIAEEIGGLDGYFLNSGLYRAKRALSEARDMLRESSVARESSVMESSETMKSKRHHLEKIQESSASALNSADYLGSYKITVTPTVEESWSTSLPNREWVSPNTALTAKLLEAYNPSKYPDFIFGKYGSGDRLHKPVSATLSYMEQKPLFFDRETFSAARRSSLPSASANRYASDYNAATTSASSKLNSSNLYSSESATTAAANTSSTSRRSAAAQDSTSSYASKLASNYYNDRRNLYNTSASDNSRYNKNYYTGSYDSSTDSAYIGNKTRRINKYYHLLIPKHYPGTPMLGGYLLPSASPYTWRY